MAKEIFTGVLVSMDDAHPQQCLAYTGDLRLVPPGLSGNLGDSKTTFFPDIGLAEDAQHVDVSNKSGGV